MALLRIRRRRNAASQVEETARGALELASNVAAEAMSEVSRKPRRARRLGLGLLALAVVGALATALFVWWSRRREDEEFARLVQEPERSWPPSAPVAPPAPPAPFTEAVATHASTEPAATQPVAPAAESRPASPIAPGAQVSEVPAPSEAAPVNAVAQPWASPSPRFAQSESNTDPAPRSGWNSHRDVPLFVLPPRPSVPFRGGGLPSVDRTHLPGSSSTFRR